MTITERTNFEQYIERMSDNLRYKLEILNYIPKREGLRILDFGCGSGILSKHICEFRPDCIVHALDSNLEMLKVAKLNNSADRYFENIERLQYNKYDVIILSSVLHESEDKFLLMDILSQHIDKENQGCFIIRDGYYDDRTKHPITAMKLRDVEDAKFFKSLAGDSLVGNLKLEFEGDYVIGQEKDIRNFLQTYTWGAKSLHREKDELHLISESTYREIQEVINSRHFYIHRVCQDQYFHHLDRIVKIEEPWLTHAIVIYAW